MNTPFYDPDRSYQENYDQGPFGAFASDKPLVRTGAPTSEFLGHKLFLPFGIPAGPLVNAKFVAKAFERGFDVNVYKTVRTRDYPCHPWPNVLAVDVPGDLLPHEAKAGLVAGNSYREPLSITNSFGVPSKDPDIWQPDMANAVKSAFKGQVMIASFQGTKSEGGSAHSFVADYAKAAALVKETGVKILEANLSCPNEGTGNLVCYDTSRVVEITQAIKEVVGDTPLFLKLGYFESNQALQELVTAVAPMIAGLSVINTIPAKILDSVGKQALPGEGRLISGVCGAGIKWAGLDMVSRLVVIRQIQELDFKIIGVGGVTRPDDYQFYIDAGADVVMSATGAMWNPYLAEQIIDQQKSLRHSYDF